MTVTVDSVQAGELEVGPGKGNYEINVDLSKPGADGEHKIVFGLPDAHSPKSIGMSQDERQLGIAMLSLTLFDASKVPGKCE